jgi:hypothetical protein
LKALDKRMAEKKKQDKEDRERELLAKEREKREKELEESLEGHATKVIQKWTRGMLGRKKAKK